jgi:hypothetical protein
MVSDSTLHRRAFWAFFAEALPGLYARMSRGNESTRWLAVGPKPLIVAHYIAATNVGIFVRGARGTRIGHVREFLFPYRGMLAEALAEPDLRLGATFLLNTRLRLPTVDKESWPQAMAWFAHQSPLYEAALAALQAPPRAPGRRDPD